MHVLITGHTGFKGAWLTLFLSELGHTVSGVSLDPPPKSLFMQAYLHDRVAHDIRADIRRKETMVDAVQSVQPDVVIHMAAQPLVRDSYTLPRQTIETNVIGTLNVLEAAGVTGSIKALLIVTTDKVYRNTNSTSGYAEDAALGGNDPYSASKAMADILTHSWSTSFQAPPTGVVRAGNVIGGGDFSKDRLIPDLVEALHNGRRVRLRYPHAIRPWQHVLDCLNGYWRICERLMSASGADVESWNIGPEPKETYTVAEVATTFAAYWGIDDAWEVDELNSRNESSVLTLDASKARDSLGWRNFLDVSEALQWTAEWFKSVAAGQEAEAVTSSQVKRFISLSSSDPL